MTDDDRALVRSHFAKWLGFGTGCTFAGWAAAAKKLYPSIIGDLVNKSTAATLDSIFQVASEKGLFALAIFPLIRAEAQLADLLRNLRAQSQWRCGEFDLKDREYDKREGMLVDLRWVRASGVESNVLGFAPFGSMPITRRAPFVALGAWCGGHDNRLRAKPDDFVGAGDMKHDFEKEKYDGMRKQTRSQVKALCALPGGAAAITGASFCLPESFRAAIGIA
jgi:hypothetical protein